MSERVAVRKTYKLFIGGKFPRSESGRSYLVQSANVSLASRKDARDAVVAARAAVKGWAGATAYNRGQILYRVAEMLEGRREQFVTLGVPADEVDAAIDRWVWYAGWSDKLSQVYGGANPVAGPYFNLSAPEPTGVVAAVTLAEVLATSDLPGGVVNILTGRLTETVPTLAAHMDVNAIDLTGVADAELAADLEIKAAENLKRVLRPAPADHDWYADPGITRMTTLLETKTVWHPKGV